MYRHGLRVGEAIDVKWDQASMNYGPLNDDD